MDQIALYTGYVTLGLGALMTIGALLYAAVEVWWRALRITKFGSRVLRFGLRGIQDEARKKRLPA